MVSCHTWRISPVRLQLLHLILDIEEHAASSQPQLPLSRQGSSLIGGLGSGRSWSEARGGFFFARRLQICLSGESDLSPI
ncbi:hypothetical protein ZWY2020_043138 [Hordeum vulgare]|nr:hypothetical protein ZWY2020_043138 [Hordeum vulgare]